MTKEQIENETREEETTYRENAKRWNAKESQVLQHMQLSAAMKCAVLMSCRNITDEIKSEASVHANLALDYLKRYMSADEKEYREEAKARIEAATPLPAPLDDNFRVTVSKQIDAVKALTQPSILPSMGPRG